MENLLFEFILYKNFYIRVYYEFHCILFIKKRGEYYEERIFKTSYESGCV